MPKRGKTETEAPVPEPKLVVFPDPDLAETAPDPLDASQPVAVLIDRDKFFSAVRIRPFGGLLNQGQVDGMNVILTEWETRRGLDDHRWLAYMLATAFLETNRTMQPVIEAYWLSENWRRENLRYYPFYGRGLVQLTWKKNYAKMSERLGRDLVANPSDALIPEMASEIMFYGMIHGSFTGAKLGDFFNETRNDAFNARTIINGHDRAAEIAGWHTQFLEALGVKTPTMGIATGLPVAS